MAVDRLLPTEDAADLLDLVREIGDAELLPRVAADEKAGRFPRDVFGTLGKAGLLGLPFPERYGGAGQPYEVYLQVLEEIGARWASVGVGVSVQSLTCFPLLNYGTEEQRERWLPELIGGDLLGAYCLSEPDAGSDPGAMRTRATRTESGWRLDGTKAWVTHGGQADFYTVLARTGEGSRGISCFLVPADAPGLTAAEPEQKMGLTASTTASMHFDGVEIEADRLIGAEGQGLSIALAALDAGRLGIAACATGLAQAALDTAVGYARERRQFGQPIIDFEGLSFLLADMATGVEAARALYRAAARRKDAGQPFSAQAAMAKLFAADTAMRVATDAVQVLGGYGYVEDFPAERYMREAKVLQIVEGTNQIQRLVIARALRRG